MAVAKLLHIAYTSTLSLQVLYIDPITGMASPYPLAGVPGIARYSRFEIGILLPSSLQQQIDGFLTTAYNQTGSPTGLNPYDPAQIRVQVDYTLGANSPLTRYGFYYRDIAPAPNYATYSVTPPLSDFTSLVHDSSPWLENQQPPSFRARFAPPAVGHWTFSISLLINNVPVAAATGSFTVTASSHPGFLVIEPSLQKMTFADTGRVFFGIGQNIAFANLVNWGYNLPAVPASFDQQRSYIADLHANEGNFVRLRLDPWSTPIETVERQIFSTDPTTPKPLVNCLTNYDHNQRYHWEFDKTLATCEGNAIYVMLNILSDAYFSPDDPYASPYAYSWENNPYRALLGPSNCQTACNSPDGILDFFSMQHAQGIHQKQLFYINARWGYSPNIAIWEHINETDNLGMSQDHFSGAWRTYFKDCPTPAFKAAVMNWVSVMQTFMDGLYPTHIQTTGFGGYPFVDVHTGQPGQVVTGSAAYEVFSANQYGYNSHFIAERSDPNYAKSTVKVFVDKQRAFVLGEIGMGAVASRYSDRDFHNSVWAGAFSGSIATPLYWEDWDQGEWGVLGQGVTPKLHRSNFTGLSHFIRTHVKFDRGVLHPNQVTDEVIQGPLQIECVDNYYLANARHNVASATYAYGWCQNRYYWSGTDPDNKQNNPKYNAEFALYFAQTTELTTLPYDVMAAGAHPKVIFNNLLPYTVFEFRCFETVTGSQQVGTTIFASSDSTGRLAIPLDLYHDRDLNATPHHYPDLAYTLEYSTLHNQLWC